MGNSRDDSNSKGVCEKIFSALCLNFGTNHHAQHKLEPTPAFAASNTSLPTHHSSEAAPTGMARMPKAEMRMQQQVKNDNNASDLDNNDAFSGYINRTKHKIRAMSSNVGIERVASSAGDVYETKQEDDAKDMFTDFVKRSMFKIRKTSSIGSRKNISFKK